MRRVLSALTYGTVIVLGWAYVALVVVPIVILIYPIGKLIDRASRERQL